MVTFLTYFVFFCKCLGILAVTLLAVLAVDLAYYYRHNGQTDKTETVTETEDTNAKTRISQMLEKENLRRIR